MSIFQNSVLKTFKQDEKLVAARWAAFQNYKAKVEAIKDFKEEEYQDGFLKDIFEFCLGYTLKTTNPSSFNLEREKKNETDSKKADGVIYLNSEIIAVIELKDTKTKNLDRVQQQAFWYLTQHTKAKYVIISNFDELRFYFDKSTAYESFSLFNLSYDEFCKLHLLLSFENIKDETALKIKEKSNSFEQDISKKLYKDFSNFRTLLFENIVKNNPTIDKQTLLRLTQKLCDRIIFILFAEDRDLLRANMIKEIREEFINQKFTNYTLYDIYKFYFEAINKGNDKLQIPQYNGGLFAVDELLDSLIIDDFILDENVQILSNYDFASEISVNILGHIFEQSLTDLEELQANIDNVNFDKTKSKRKKDGVFYTPEYITRYIVENTLGKMCSEKREELKIVEITPPSNPKKLTKQEQQTKDNLQEYKNWLLNLKILDPACGSGAFLNQALEYLISEHKNLQNDLALMGDLFTSYMVEEEILEHNLYGVDINEDAVEIAKLSLWLRTAKRGRPLTKLVDKIKCGNSLIDDKSVVSNAFVWEEEFKEVFEQGGFDVVIGNPPYGAEIIILNEDTTESYLLFYKKAIVLLRQKGILGFITPDSWLTNNNAKSLRKMFCEEGSISSLLDTYKVFDDAPDVWCNIPIFHKSLVVDNIKINREFPYDLPIFQFKMKWSEIAKLKEKEWFPYINEDLKNIFIKMNKHNIVEKYFDTRRGFSPTPNDENITLNKTLRQIIGGEDFGRYIYKIKPKYLIDEYIKSKEQIENIKNQDFIGIQRIRTNSLDFKSRWLILQYFEKGFIPIDSIGYFLKKSNLELKYLQTILSSQLMNLYYKLHYTDKNVKPIYLKKLPIKEISLKEQEPFIQKADLMLELNKKLQELKQNFINELNLEKVPTKLQKFEELDFDDFVKEYAKAKKLKFADKLEERNFKNEWQRLFENDKKEVLEIQNQINITDKEIDQMVYKLYDLTEDEIKIVEGVS
ncbi:restriction endonuclease subunit M [Aliarcobacter skirrowii]|uniref:Eco57I restriction-modification methylase domain-containing protein n=1 Tax=Aliarcobacter skirrowii TaxID=28200 RepID=UPI00100BED92|nr:N-6 DNA methylase [Aliarcobacter skirrowii]RXJ79064.1 restriction endonuclease subunit M [Aliarcobacter skirrowii]